MYEESYFSTRDFGIMYELDTDMVTFYSTYPNGDEVTTIKIDPYDLTSADLECYIYYYSKNQGVFATGYINMNTYDGEEKIPLNIEGKIDGISKKDIKKDVYNEVNILLYHMAEILDDKGIAIYDLGFKNY